VPAEPAVRAFVQKWIEAFDEHKLLTYATAIAMRAFIGLIGLTFLTLALMAPLGQQSAWSRHLAPAIEPKLTTPTYHAVDAAVHRIFASDSTGLIAFAAALAIWQTSGVIRAVMDALNTIIDAEDDRPTTHRFALSVVLAIAVIVLIATALFVVAVGGRLIGASPGPLHWVVAVLRWPVGAIPLAVAVALVARFAPVEYRGPRWASVGAILIVIAWLVVSALYAWFLQHVTYRSASGNLLVVVMIATYLYVSSIVFLMGAQLDEFLREAAGGESHLTFHAAVRRALAAGHS
jgi:membrane protein